jgi:type IV pilus assembly protein PilO
MQWNNLPFWSKALIIAIIGGAVVFVGYKFPPANIAERRQDITSLDEQIRNLESEVRTAEAAAAKRKEVEAEIARLDGELLALRSMLPERRETGALLKFVRDTAERMTLDLQLFNPEPEVKQEFVTVVPVRIRVLGGYHALGEFYEALGGHIRIIFVDDVSIQPAPRTGTATVDATFTATTYIYNEPEVTVAGEEAGA